MRSLILGSVLALALGAPTMALAVTIPLQDGVYSRGACADLTTEPYDTIGLYTLTKGRERGKQFMTPRSDEVSGNCTPERVKVSGTHYSGRAPCSDGTLEMASGVYDFDIQVVDRQTFISRGATYRWCAAHR